MPEEQLADAQPRGATFDDLAAFLRAPEPGGYPVHEVRECVCRSCGGRAFEVAVLEEEQAARRTCLGCGEREFIADSAEYWDDDAEADHLCACPCGEEEFAGAVAFSVREGGDIRWLWVGLRCLACGTMGVYEDWKIDYGPSNFLLDRA